MPLVTVTVPCYNSSDYMDRCIQSLVGTTTNPEELEIIIVNDGSNRDDTAHKADLWAQRYPKLVTAIHQDNAGHGGAVMTGLDSARGQYFKVVDSDDFVDSKAFKKLLSEIVLVNKSSEKPIDLFISNYVYENKDENTRTPINYVGVLPENRRFTWDEVGTFKPQQNLLMHSLLYRTHILKESGLRLPKHTFYVDNIFAYVPLPCVSSLYYKNADLYRYQIGREDQSVNERVMISRIDQQLRITRIMIDSYVLPRDITSKRLRDYMFSYLTMMMVISTIFSRLSDDPDALENLDHLWRHLERHDKAMYRRIRYSALALAATLPGSLGKRVSVGFYHIAQRIFGFN